MSSKKLAEGVGFEPTVPCETAVFKTASLGHSDTPPEFKFYRKTATEGKPGIASVGKYAGVAVISPGLSRKVVPGAE